LITPFTMFRGLLAYTLFTCAVLAKPVSRWPEILKVLNQNPSTSHVLQGLDGDLLALYRSELKAIDALWAATPDAKRDKKLAETRRLTNVFYHEQVKALNDKTFSALDLAPSRGKDYAALAQKILDQVRSNPVAKLESWHEYDPSGQLGFCFGRALLSHYLLLKAGVKQDDIGKVFVAGQLRVASRMWTFHVAVLIRDEKQGFLVVDSLLEKPVSLAEWRDRTASYDIKGDFSRARFYVTDPRKFVPTSGGYSQELISEENLKKYFDELALSMPPP
jgi:hypothetical protein